MTEGQSTKAIQYTTSAKGKHPARRRENDTTKQS
jgi:hypothetical protein